MEKVMLLQPFSRANSRFGSTTLARLSIHGNWLHLIIWLGFLSLSLGLFIATIPARYLYLRDRVHFQTPALETLGIPPDILPAYTMTLDALASVTYVVVAVLIFWRKPREWVSFLTSLTLLIEATVIVRPADSLFFVDPRLRIPMLVLFALGTSLICSLLYIFPDGRLARRWMFWVGFGSVTYCIGVYLVPAFAMPTLRWPPDPISPFVLLALAGGVAIQAYRYRQCSSHIQRQQTKWIIFGLTIGVTDLMLFVIVVPALWPQVHMPGIENIIYYGLGTPILYASLTLIPLTIAGSILHYRLWDIDVLINRTLVYLLATAILAGTYTALIAPTQRLFVALTGQQSDLTVVLATLIAAAAFTPIKNHLQIVIDMHWKETQDVAKRLIPFTQQIETRIGLVHNKYILEHLLKETIAAFNARGGAVYWETDGSLEMSQAQGDWNGDAKATANLAGTTHTSHLGTLELAARRNGVDYSERDRQVLQQITSLVAEAIEADRLQGQVGMS